MTAAEAAQAQSDSAQDPVLAHGVERVLRASGMKATAQPQRPKEARQNRRDRGSINSQPGN
jgi:hypothetical protein